ncbi:hypothetical protein M9411_03505 [Pasteurella multocida]|uniref:hypothetical protein n=1 Tax=Pasteurella multocida TaxID=747 RepID=UPI002023E3F6|nr:hypothetical protein [Pasteurella multocida]URJ85781.1 hypothetical protein M9411_03505 [Pasteurella multocida]
MKYIDILSKKRFKKKCKRSSKIRKSTDRFLYGSLFRCPEYLTVYDEKFYEKTLGFINSLEMIATHKIKKAKISFVNCKELKAAAIVLLYAKLDSIIKLYDIELEIIGSITSPKVNKMLKISGFYELLNRKGTLEHKFNEFESFLPVINGVGGQYRDEIVDFIKEKIYKNGLSPSQEHIYGDAIQEAINNVSIHAYPNSAPEHKKWWVKCDLVHDELFLVLYDQGEGIPSTFVKGNKLFDEIDWNSDMALEVFSEVRKRFNLDIDRLDPQFSSKDSVAISLAMYGDLTRMEGKDELKHGQGSKSIKKLVSSNQNGVLWVFSNSGLFKYENEDTLPVLADFSQSINGTLIQWNIKVRYE